MLDIDLADIYGYQTKHFNVQIKNNIDRFDEDFRFQLTRKEADSILRSKFSTSRWGGIRHLPYAFTEQGIYMLMTVLKGELAVSQSKALIRTFKMMKDMLLQKQNLLGEPDLLKLSLQTADNTIAIEKIKNEMVTKADLSRIIKDFSNPDIRRDYLFFNGETVEANIAYSSIYANAKKSVCIVDNYINLKTLVLLKDVKVGLPIMIFTDNVSKGLHKIDFDDFCSEYPGRNITFKRTNKLYHDRYVFIDPGTRNEKIFHCGASSKDAGRKVTSISQVTDVSLYKDMIKELMGNKDLALV